MQTELEEMTKEYSLACVEAVRDTIHKLALEWGDELVDTLKESGFKIATTLYGGGLCIEAYVGKNASVPERYIDRDINAGVQESFDNLSLQVTLNAMIWESAEQITYWEIA